MTTMNLVASPVTFYDGKHWRNDILIRYSAADRPEIFASVYGESKEIATMRAAATVIAIKKDVRNDDQRTSRPHRR